MYLVIVALLLLFAGKKSIAFFFSSRKRGDEWTKFVSRHTNACHLLTSSSHQLKSALFFHSFLYVRFLRNVFHPEPAIVASESEKSQIPSSNRFPSNELCHNTSAACVSAAKMHFLISTFLLFVLTLYYLFVSED